MVVGSILFNLNDFPRFFYYTCEHNLSKFTACKDKQKINTSRQVAGTHESTKADKLTSTKADKHEGTKAYKHTSTKARKHESTKAYKREGKASREMTLGDYFNE